MNNSEPDKKNTLHPDEEAPENFDTDITRQELDLLDEACSLDDDEIRLHRSDLDSTDDDGTALNEKASATDRSGRQLDVPGSNADNIMEDIGAEDEENNAYSLKDKDV